MKQRIALLALFTLAPVLPGAATTLEVLEGRVQFTCRFDSKKVMVAGGFSSTADISGPVGVVPLP